MKIPIMAGHPWIATSLVEGDCWRLEEWTDAFSSLSLSDAQSPDLISMIGGSAKSKLLRELITTTVALPSQLGPHNKVHLWADPRSHRGDTPRIFVDCELHRERPPMAQQHRPAKAPQRYRDISWTGQHGHAEIAHILYNRVIAPLSSVVCYFASDLGGLRGVAKLFADQLISDLPSNRPRPDALPRALVVVDTSSHIFDSWEAETRLYREIDTTLRDSDHDPCNLMPRLLDHFREVRVLGLYKDSSPELRSKVLQRRIASVSASVQSTRRLSRTLFTARHAFPFLSMLIDNFCDGRERFDYIKFSRAAGYCVEDFPTHLRELLNTMPSEAWLWHTVAPLVASALLLASYPPGSHCKYHLSYLDLRTKSL